MSGHNDGDPEGGGALVGTGSAPELAAGASVPVAVTTTAAPGSHAYRFIADHGLTAQDANRNNNDRALLLFVPSSPLPDLAVSRLTQTARPAYPDEPVEVTATVRNLGAFAPSSRFIVLLGGLPVGSGTIPPLLPGESATLLAQVSSTQSLALRLDVDVDQAIAEFDETNNSASASFDVASSGLSVSVVATPASAGPNVPVSVTWTLANGGLAPRHASVTVSVLGTGGEEVATLSAGIPHSVAPGAIVGGTAFWNSERLAAGDYRIMVEAFADGRRLASNETIVTVTATSDAITQVTTDRRAYRPGQEVVVSQRVTNLSLNSSLIGARMDVELRDAVGAVLYASSRTLPELPSGGFLDTADLFEVSRFLPVGPYFARTALYAASGSLLSVDIAGFSVEYSASELLAASVVAPNPIGVGLAFPVEVSLQNLGTVPLQQGELEALLIDATTLSLEARATERVDLAAGASAQKSLLLTPLGGTEGQKLLVVQIDGRVVERILVLAVQNYDREPPLIVVEGVSDATLTNVDVTPTVRIEDQSAFTATVTLDGAPFVGGTTISSEGEHVLLVEAEDVAANRAQLTVRFTLDKTAPVLTLVGPDDGAFLRAAAALSFSADDVHLQSVTATLDQQPLGSGELIAVEGSHTWTVTARDSAGNVVSSVRTFTLDFTAPVVSVLGVVETDVLGASTTVDFSAADSYLDTLSATLNGQPFSDGDWVAGEGQYLLVVSAADRAGNETREEVRFALDFTPPAIQVSGVSEGEFLRVPAEISFSAGDPHLQSVSATLDGVDFASSGSVFGEGPHLLVVTAVDLAGNVASRRVPFTQDFTPPQVQLSGVADGAVVQVGPTVSFTATDAHLSQVLATVDGTTFEGAISVTSQGPHLVEVEALDLAGNRTQGRLAFVVDSTPPAIAVTGVQDGQHVNHPVALGVAVADPYLESSEVVLDGAAYVPGTTVTAEGAHLLAVEAADRAGNHASLRRAFVLDFTPPAVGISGVADGEIADSFEPAFSATDLNLHLVVALLDGQPFVGGARVNAPGAHLLSVEAEDRAGNRTVVTVRFTVVSLVPTFDFAVCAVGNLVIQNSARVEAPFGGMASVAANGDLELWNSASVSGDAVAGGNTVLANHVRVGGELVHGGSSSHSGQARAVGGTRKVTPAPAPCGCGYDLPARLRDARRHNDNAVLQTDPTFAPHLTNGVLDLRNADVQLPAGVFQLEAVYLRGGARLGTMRGAKVTLFVAKSVVVENRATLGANPSLGGGLTVVSAASALRGERVQLQNHSTAHVRLFAPDADIVLESYTAVVGAVVGRDVTLRNNQNVSLAPTAQSRPPRLQCP